MEGERAKRSAEEEDEDETSNEIVEEKVSKESKEETSEELYVDDSSNESKRSKRSAEYTNYEDDEALQRDKRDADAAPAEEKKENEGKHKVRDSFTFEREILFQHNHHKGGRFNKIFEELGAKV